MRLCLTVCSEALQRVNCEVGGLSWQLLAQAADDPGPAFKHFHNRPDILQFWHPISHSLRHEMLFIYLLIYHYLLAKSHVAEVRAYSLLAHHMVCMRCGSVSQGCQCKMCML